MAVVNMVDTLVVGVAPRSLLERLHDAPQKVSVYVSQVAKTVTL
jgi:hypothetical protein